MSMAVDTLEMAQAIRRSGLSQEQADTIAEQIGKGLSSEELATKEFVRAEIAGLRAELHQEMGGLRMDLRGEMAELRADLRGEMTELRADLRNEMGELRTELHKQIGGLHRDMGQQSWKMAAMLLLQAGLIAALTRLF